ncbi:MAG: single-strand DNA-binding protein [Psychromonas sp.]|jgi:single-strand DNA-binding protein
MSTVFETKLIGNIGRDAIVNEMDRGVVAINFPVAHNKNWTDRKTGESKTRTTWINCTIWKKDGAKLKIVDFLKKGTLVDLTGTPYAKSYSSEDGVMRSEIRLNVSSTNVLRPAKESDGQSNIESSWEDEENQDFAKVSYDDEDL